MRKLIICMILVLSMTFAAGAFALQINDIDGHWAAKQIYKMTAKKVVYGYSDGSFKPDKGITHLEAVVMILRLLALEEATKSTYPSSMFADKISKAPTWAKGYITIAYEKGIVKDADLAKILKNSPATRQDVAVYIYRSFITSRVNANTAAELKFTDLNAINQSAKTAVAAVVDQGIIKGNPDGTFKPAKGVSRAEIVAMLNIYDEKITNEIDLENTGSIENLPETVTGTISLKNAGGQIVPLELNTGVVIYRNNQKVDFSALKKGDAGLFVMDPGGKIQFVDVQGS